MGRACASYLILIVSVLVSLLIFSTTRADASNGKNEFGWMTGGSTCQGSMAECLTDNEFLADTEINRRILATSDYISYQALKSNSVPCSQRGASYYNCQSGASANPYTRSCSALARCRS